MAKKTRKCAVCGKDLTNLNYAMVMDRDLGKVITVCPGRCYQTKMMKGWAKR